MLKSFVIAVAALLVSASASAGTNCAHAAEHAQELAVASAQPVIQSAMIQSQVSATALKWKVGDKADYKMAGGILNGSVKSFVREDLGSEIWVQQDMDMGFLGKQKVEILFDKATGQVKKLLANGQEQSLPDTSNIEIVETKEASVTVPAGTFDAIYAKI
jgi:hypothetical protein